MAVRQIQTETLYWCSVPSVRGICYIFATRYGICWVGTPGTSLEDGIAQTRRWFRLENITHIGNPLLEKAQEELHRYFAGECVQFTCPLDLHGTPFQLLVWQALTKIPYGKTCSYSEIAQAIGQPKASRAVGAANGANPVPIIVPCHRVIGRNGTLTGYGSGLPTKSWLLSLEGISHTF
ncbi:methylated-DNA--[protein]-cysteine S-methyltransferase [Tengunoibacter tsumagoiensis]|uniref:Methylated-DNA--protein-cysteine methyltransferase n=1 Tax=Tengunoibacter tsumagoiensis TaxID=2014871 RepID=A0A402A265_9CHLR|nr:methylated-DNA--[protein]-cysteine S-methyltransferase [Tengunoibacter tsumagoiensis]GCE13230.1 hypothetical protein KTT_30890 [Tengunoibacter tsumagoiensis]